MARYGNGVLIVLCKFSILRALT